MQKLEQLLVGFIDKRYLSVCVFLVFLMCGYGIYLGRYERWNSWDLVTNPFGLAGDIIHHVIHPFRNKDIWILSAAFGTWMFLIYQQLVRLKKSR